MKRIIILAILTIWITGFIWGQETKQSSENKNKEESPQKTEQIDPIFPEENPNIIFIEGEDAISTNFNKEPTLNYSCSDLRTLQLSRSTGLQGGASFYADYVFYVQEPGDYELWYGGTPPGPKDDLYPSFTSPFTLIVDNNKPKPQYREDIVVVENYAPAYYWNLVEDIKLSQGEHKIRFEVTEKRKFDGRYYFYLDCFFLVKKENGRRVLGEPIPKFFPKNMGNRKINFPFRSIDDYQIIIRDNPTDPRPLTELSLIYSLLNDYLNAIRYLKKAQILAPDDLNILLLIAKNRIWKGDVKIGLKRYREYLTKNPNRLDIWMEAGKVAAWTGRYDDSVAFYKDGLKYFKNNLDLLVNLGLTYLWSNRGTDAEKTFKQAKKIAGKNLKLIKELAKTFLINGYYDRAIALYKKAIEISPPDLESYFLLENTYMKKGDKEKVQEVEELIKKTFKPSPKLARYMKVFKEKQLLKERVIAEYERKLREQPDNLTLRMTLAQTYFWNGLKEKAINEYLNILATHAFIELKKMDSTSFSLLELTDKSYIYTRFFNDIKSITGERINKLKKSYYAYTKALSDYKKFQEKVQKARENGKELPTPKGEDPQDVLNKKQEELGDEIGKTEEMINNLQEIISQFKEDISKLPPIKEKLNKEEKTFQQIIKANRWKWNRGEFLKEMEENSKRGLILADYIQGKVFQIEKRYSSALKKLQAATEQSPNTQIYQYALFQTELWSAKEEQPEEIVNRYSNKINDYVPYFSNLEELTERIKTTSLTENFTPVEIDEENAKTDIEELTKQLSEIKKSVEKENRNLKKSLRTMHLLLKKKLIRIIYRYEENTYLIRNELGGFYLTEKKLDKAIKQFNYVLSVEPNNLSAIYKIGTIYQWNRNWHKAMLYYKRVYKMDPLYENTISLYNQLSKQYSPKLNFQSYMLTDTSSIHWQGTTDYIGFLNSILGIHLIYQTDVFRIKKSYNNNENHTFYQTHQFLTGIPIDLFFMNLRVTPYAGITIVGNDLYYTTENTNELLSTVVNYNDFIYSYSIVPFIKVDSSFGLGKYVYLNGTYYNGQFSETYSPTRISVFDNSGELNISTSLSFIDAPILRDTSLRTYGKIDILSDGNKIYTGVQEIYSHILKGGNPYSLLTLIGNFTLQNSERAETYNYYTPIGVLMAGGGLMGSTWIGIGNDNVLGLSLRTYAGTYQERIFTPANTTRRLKLEGELNANLTAGNGYFYIGAIANGTLPFREDNTLGNWDYWSFYLKLGYNAKLPDILYPH